MNKYTAIRKTIKFQQPWNLSSGIRLDTKVVTIYFLKCPIFFFFNFYFYFILLYNMVLVLPYIDMNPPWVYMRSQTGADYTEWSKPERKTPIQYTNTYIWNLERWQWWPCMQDSNKMSNFQQKSWDMEKEKKCVT